ncbi:hypothetical protein SARC_11711 [Sphaeroforma arctica JP610]|uniref:Uncharacterized protein n=1 Tax=Sphaeroforma arctica JP610 TaxID=667725 RepID=A0A0L0FH19_9EUKA|nr:hypothetical protein SARC_11711 [Sphaeroforma arctica JP610]KNC75771.1 hypothetical protein SARC_11711 [Sphaeroforma arctica JP610]|eukprot:XP_014149673.1 hypothetical protein SARC_11711 [Sphaeroforma arctica JP610]
MLVQMGYAPATSTYMESGEKDTHISAYDCLSFVIAEYHKLDEQQQKYKTAWESQEAQMTVQFNKQQSLLEKLKKAEYEVANLTQSLAEHRRKAIAMETKRVKELQDQEKVINKLRQANSQLEYRNKRKMIESEDTKDRLRQVLQKRNTGLSTIRMISGVWDRTSSIKGAAHLESDTPASNKTFGITYELEKRHENEVKYLFHDNEALRDIIRTLAENYNQLLNSFLDAKAENNEDMDISTIADLREIFPLDDCFYFIPAGQLHQRINEILSQSHDGLSHIDEDISLENDSDSENDDVETKRKTAYTPTSADAERYRRVIAAQKKMIEELLNMQDATIDDTDNEGDENDIVDNDLPGEGLNNETLNGRSNEETRLNADIVMQDDGTEDTQNYQKRNKAPKKLQDTDDQTYIQSHAPLEDVQTPMSHRTS